MAKTSSTQHNINSRNSPQENVKQNLESEFRHFWLRINREQGLLLAQLTNMGQTLARPGAVTTIDRKLRRSNHPLKNTLDNYLNGLRSSSDGLDNPLSRLADDNDIRRAKNLDKYFIRHTKFFKSEKAYIIKLSSGIPLHSIFDLVRFTHIYEQPFDSSGHLIHEALAITAQIEKLGYTLYECRPKLKPNLYSDMTQIFQKEVVTEFNREVVIVRCFLEVQINTHPCMVTKEAETPIFDLRKALSEKIWKTINLLNSEAEDEDFPESIERFVFSKIVNLEINQDQTKQEIVYFLSVYNIFLHSGNVSKDELAGTLVEMINNYIFFAMQSYQMFKVTNPIISSHDDLEYIKKEYSVQYWADKDKHGYRGHRYNIIAKLDK